MSKKIGIGHPVCPHCKTILHNHKPLEGKKKPEDGDISFCASCGRVSEFRNGELVRIKSFKDLDDDVKEQINKIKADWKLLKKDDKEVKSENETI